MFAVWGWGVGINGTSSVVAVSSIFSEYMDFFYFCTCSPWKRKKKSQILCAVWGNLEWHSRSPSLAESWLWIVQRGMWAQADGSSCFADTGLGFLPVEKSSSHLLRHRDLTCTEQVPLSTPVVGAGPGYHRAPPHPASPAQTSHLATARSRAGENPRMFVVEALNSRHLPTGGVAPL